MDTTSFKTNIVGKQARQKRKVIADNLITPHIFDLLLTKVYSEVENIDAINQRDIINVLMPLHIGNKTIARVVNTLIPNAKATQGSIAAYIRSMKKYDKGQNELVNALMKELEEEFK